MSQVITRVLWQLNSLKAPIPQVQDETAEGLDTLFSVGNKLIAAMVNATKRLYGSSRAVVLHRELEYARVGITGGLFGERNPGSTKDFKGVCDRYKSCDKSTLSKMLKVVRAEFFAAERILGALSGAYTLVSVEPVEVPPVAALVATATPDEVAVQQATNLAEALSKVESAETFQTVFDIVNEQLTRGYAIIKAADDSVELAA